MNDEPPDDRAEGRLRAEDRRGKMRDEHLDLQKQSKKRAPQDPEKNWEENQGGKNGRKITIALAALIFLGTTGLLSLSFFQKPHSPEPQNPSNLALPMNFIEKSPPEEIKLAIQNCISGFMNSSTNEERCRFIIGGQQMLPLLHEYYQRPGIDPPSNFGQIYQNNKAAFGGIAMHAIVALETDETSAWIFNVLPTQTAMKIDWESSVCYGEKSWENFQKSKPTSPTLMRVHLARSSDENQMIDPQKFASCKIYVRGNDQSLPGFFPLDSQVASTLKKIIPPGGRQPIRAKLRWNLEGTAVEVAEVIHNFWIDLAHYQQIFESTAE